MNLFAPVEIKLYMLLGIFEVLVVLLIVVFVLYRKVKLYKPHYQANTSPVDYIKRYYNKVLDHTRKYANKLAPDAVQGDPTALKKRKSMVARLNWLVLEKDFISIEYPNNSYWDDISFRIQKMLKRWEEIAFIDGPPNDDAVTRILEENPDGESSAQGEEIIDEEGKEEYDPEKGDISRAGPQGLTNEALKRRVQYLEKQIRKLGSYKTLYYGLQKTYEGMQKSYKALKRTINDMQLSAEDAEKLKNAIAEHEASEAKLKQEMDKMDAAKERMNQELHQLEDAYVKLEEEHFEQQAQMAPTFSAELTALKDGEASDELISYQELFDHHDNVLREFRGFLHSLELDTDTKLEIDDHSENLEKTKEEIKTCVSVLEMERDRLNKELKSLKGEPDSEISSEMNDSQDDAAA